MGTRKASAQIEQQRAEETRCPICQDEREEPVVTPCNHAFCRSCIMTSLRKYGNTCPMCREQINSHRVLVPYTPSCSAQAAIGSSIDDDRAKWTCNTCTCVNSMTEPRCAACGGRRPTIAAPSARTGPGVSTHEAALFSFGSIAGASQFARSKPTKYESKRSKPTKHESKRRKARGLQGVRIAQLRISGDDPSLHTRTELISYARAHAHDAGDDARVEQGATDDDATSGPVIPGAALVTWSESEEEPDDDDDVGHVERRPRKRRPRKRAPESSHQALAAAEREGLELVTSNNVCGFKGVTRHDGKFQAGLSEGGNERYLGRFGTAEEAALAYARHVGRARAAREAAEARGEGPQPLTAEQVRAAAAQEELELVPANSTCGFRGVKLGRNDKFEARFSSEGGRKRTYLGMFDTAEAAALAYARHVKYIGKERAPTPAQVRAVAAQEGLELVPASNNRSGFRGVARFRDKFQAQEYDDGKPKRHLGMFDTAEAAALAYARHVGKERAAREAAEARAEGGGHLARATAEQARAAAAQEGLQLLTSANNLSGFRGVTPQQGGCFIAKIKQGGRIRCLGRFATAEAGALAFARQFRKVQATREAAAARGEGPPLPLTAEQAREAAAQEGLELVLADTASGFKGVYADRGKFNARIDATRRYLGRFDTAEEAALACARHLGRERVAKEAEDGLAIIAGAVPVGADPDVVVLPAQIVD